MPSTPFDAKGLMLSAISDNNPVLIFEHRWLMKKDGLVPEGIYKVPIGKGIYRRRGEDLTIEAPEDEAIRFIPGEPEFVHFPGQSAGGQPRSEGRRAGIWK